jgi:hypothetical protein
VDADKSVVSGGRHGIAVLKHVGGGARPSHSSRVLAGPGVCPGVSLGERSDDAEPAIPAPR